MKRHEIEKAEQRIECLEAEAQRLREQVREARESAPADPLGEAAAHFSGNAPIELAASATDVLTGLCRVEDLKSMRAVAQLLEDGHIEVVPGRENARGPALVLAHDHQNYGHADTPTVLIIRRTRSEG